MAETPAKRQKVDCNSQAPSEIPSFEDFAPDGDVIFIVQGKTRVRVFSAVIKCASPVFAAMLKPNFKEGRALAKSGDSPIEIPLPEDNPEELGWICRALHCQAHTMLWKPTIPQLWSVWLLVDKYDMKDSMQLSLKLWTSKKLPTAINFQRGHDLWILTVLSIMNRDADNFKIASCELILKGTKPFKALASNMEHDTQNAASEGVIYRLAGELQAIRDCAMMKAIKNKSITKTRPRSSTKGPLDLDDDPLLSPPQPAPQRTSSIAQRNRLSSPHPRSSAGTPISQLGEAKPKDFSFLLRPEIYHPLTPLNVPVAFRNPQKQPNPEAPIEELVANGHFRAAAIAAVQELTGSGASGGISPTNSKRIFELLYTRLACLTLIDATPLAAQEVKAMEDLNDIRKYVDETSGEHLVPWELRVLNIRLQSLGFGDYRRAVMSYHDLAREARERITKAAAQHDNSAREVWKARLHDLGIQVAGALIELEDLTGAAQHLNTLRDRGDGKMALTKALLWLHLGDVESARACARQAVDSDENVEKLILALCDMADSEYESALDAWKELKETMDDEMVGVNTAVCLLYLGRIQEGRAVLEELVDSGLSSHTLLFNLSTMYELCTERHKNMKIKLTERIAGMEASAAGWEKTNSDFKL
ncbi:hypothetical protein FPSE5266_05232 [Fusarium pseudograminearum]|nr:hypothetical protein FPSE5266_05232 [Fusarium pseudograminearum]